MGSRLKSTEEFISNSIKRHGDRYGYEESVYSGCYNDVIITCKIHGNFLQQASRHVNGAGCSECGKISHRNKILSNTDRFVLKATNLHGNLYDYSHVDYVGNKTPVAIKCNIHGLFYPTPSNHLLGSKCPDCSKRAYRLGKDEWIRLAGNRLGKFYILRFYNETESFYKFGITFNTVKDRYRGKKSYKYEIVRLIISSDKEYICDLEKRFRKYKANNRYTPQIPFKGSKFECFSTYTYKKEKQE